MEGAAYIECLRFGRPTSKYYEVGKYFNLEPLGKASVLVLYTLETPFSDLYEGLVEFCLQRKLDPDFTCAPILARGDGN